MAVSLRLAPSNYKHQKMQKKKRTKKIAEISLKESLMANIMGLSFPHQGSDLLYPDLLLVSKHKF